MMDRPVIQLIQQVQNEMEAAGAITYALQDICDKMVATFI